MLRFWGLPSYSTLFPVHIHGLTNIWRRKMQVSLYFRTVRRRRKERCNEWSGRGGDDEVEPGARKSQGSFSFNNNNNNKILPPNRENFMEILGIKTVGIPPQQSQGCRVREVGESEAQTSGSE